MQKLSYKIPCNGVIKNEVDVIICYFSVQEAWKVLTILKNNNQPIIRKRQLMRTHFGDYRAKMAAEEKKLIKSMSRTLQHSTNDSSLHR